MPRPLHRKIVVVGSANMDMVFNLPRLPVKGETVGGGSFSAGFGGKGANQAVAVARLGIVPVLVACVGDDNLGAEMLRNLEEEGVDCSRISQVTGPSGVAAVIVDQRGDNIVATATGANALLSPERAAAAQDLIGQASLLMVQQEIPSETVKAALVMARKAGTTTLLDPAPVNDLDRQILSLVDYITPNAGEASLLTGVDVHCWNTAAQAAARLHALGVKTVLVTMGRLGAYYSGPDGKVRIAAPSVLTVDTTGAGDAFNGALAAALVHGVQPDEAADIAAVAGALATTKIGAQTAFPGKEELEALIDLPW